MKSESRGSGLDAGFTLMETVVALALFMSILIPLGVMMGSLMFYNGVEQMQEALHRAETEIAKMIVSKSSEALVETKDGLIISKDAQREGNLLVVTVTVSSAKHPQRQLVSLRKTVLSYK